MEEIFNAISNFGFPIVITVYLLVRFERKLDLMTEVLNDLKNEIEKLNRN